MRYLKLSLIIVLILLALNLFSQVILQEVNISTELTGPFTKNRAEFIFHNNSDEDAQEANIQFELNSSAVVTDMWLEINGELVIDETFRVDTGSKIYQEFIPRKKDPALLVKMNETNYRLRVFPFAAAETRRVVIAYYSILETIEQELSWQFNISLRGRWGKLPESVINVKGSINDPSWFSIFHNSEKIGLDDESNFKLTSINKMKFKLNIFEAHDPYSPKVGNYNEKAIARDIKPFSKFEKIENINIVPYFIGKYLTNLETKKFLLSSETKIDNEFLNEFYKFLDREYPENTPFYHIYSNFYKNGSTTYYLDPNYSYKYTTTAPSVFIKAGLYKCDFVDTFYNYIEVLEQNIETHIKSRFLTPKTSKLVLEDTNEAKKIRRNMLRKEKDHKLVTPNISPKLGSTSRFMVYEDPPVAIKRVAPIYSKESVLLMDKPGDVYLNVEVFKNGKVGLIEVMKSLHPILDELAIEAVKQWEFNPAKSGGEAVAVWVSFPITFEASKYSDLKISENVVNFHLYGKMFQLINDEWTMEKFAPQRTEYLDIYSNNFFPLLKDNPELINIAYWFCMRSDFLKLGIVTNSDQSIWLVR